MKLQTFVKELSCNKYYRLMSDREPSTSGKSSIKFNIRERHMDRVESMLEQREYVDGEATYRT